MQISEEFKSGNPNIIQHSMQGFWKYFLHNCGWVFTVFPAIIVALGNTMSLKTCAYLLCLSLIISLLYAFYKNMKKALIKIDLLESDLNPKKDRTDELVDLKVQLEVITKNRDTILDEYDKYKSESFYYQKAYFSAKNSLFAIADAYQDNDFRNIIFNLFNRIEDEVKGDDLNA